MGGPPPRLTQISTIDALLAGDYDGTITVGELKSYGDFGIGTFDGLDGEMILLDGHCYQADWDGIIHSPGDEVTVPYATVTFFDPESEIELRELSGLETVSARIDKHLQTDNIFYGIKIEGRFSSLRLRSVARQESPYRPMADFIRDEQKIAEYASMEGTIVGFRSPPYAGGIGVPGYHFHFIDSNRRIGGHVLEMSVERAVLSIGAIREFQMILPSTGRFDRLPLGNDRSGELRIVEGEASEDF